MQDDRPLRVLHVIDSLWGGGAEASAVAWLREAARTEESIEHHLMVLRDDERSRTVAADLGLPTTFGGRRDDIHPGDALGVRRMLAATSPDLVHAVLHRSTLAARLALVGRRIPLLVTLTSVFYEVDRPEPRLRVRWVRRLLHTAHGWALRSRKTAVHAISEAVAAEATRRFGITAIGVVPDLRPDPMPLIRRTRETTRALLGRNPTAPLLISVAREHPVKDHLTTLAALDRVRRHRPTIGLILAGPPGPATGAIDAFVGDHELDAHIVRLGYRDDIPDLLAAADVFVSTSTSEGLGGAVLEAMGVGLPVVAVDNPGTREALGPGHPGLVPPGDPVAVADRIESVLADPELGISMGAAGRARFLERFEVAANTPRMTALMHAAATRTRRGRGTGAH